MGDIEPQGLPAVRLAPIQRLRARDALSDEDMVRIQRANLIDPGAPNPSGRDHCCTPFCRTNSSTTPMRRAVLSLADQPDAAERCADLYGAAGRDRAVPSCRAFPPRPRRRPEVFEQDPAGRGPRPRKARRFQRWVGCARGLLADDRDRQPRRRAPGARPHRRMRVEPSAKLPAPLSPPPADIAPIVRGACARSRRPGDARSLQALCARFPRRAGEVLNFVNGAELSRYGLAGVATPDHTIRTKNYPMIVAPPPCGGIGDFAATAREAVEAFVAEYHAYFARHNAVSPVKKRELDPMPRVVLVPGLGLFGLGRSARDAAVAADLAESWVTTVTDAEAIGTFESLPEAELFEMEYWSLEQAKLGGAVEKPLAGQVALVTGGGGTIRPLATALHCAERRRRRDRACSTAPAPGPKTRRKSSAGSALAADVTDPAARARRLRPSGRPSVSAGSTSSSPMPARPGRAASARLTRRCCGRALSSISSPINRSRKTRCGSCGRSRPAAASCSTCQSSAVNPGAQCRPLRPPKGGDPRSLMRQYALEYGAEGIRANAVNADGIRGGFLTPD